MDLSYAEEFARDWIDVWNRHDLPAILEHYSDSVVFHSPRISVVMGEQKDRVEGKEELQAFWSRALQAAPNLHFELGSVLVGSDAMTILYRNHRGQDVAETFVFEHVGGRVSCSIATYR